MIEKTEAAVEELSHLWEKGNRLFQEKLADGDTAVTPSTAPSMATISNSSTSASISSAMADLKKAQESASASYGPRLSRIMKRMELFMQIGDLALKRSPPEAELVWSCFGFIFQMGLNDSEACELLTDGVDVATDAIFAAEVYGKRHYHDHMVAAPAAADSQAKRLNETVLDKIPYVYAAVLEFTYNARKFMKHGKTGRMIRFYKMPLKMFRDNVDQIKTKKDDLSRLAGIGFEEAARDGLKSIQNVLKKLDELEKLGQQLEALKKRREGEWQAKEEEQARQEYQDQIQWFRTTADPAKRHQKNLGRKQAGTCRWLLQEPDYKRWKETSEIPLLWLSATQGFGKSILVSSIIEALETETTTAAKPDAATEAAAEAAAPAAKAPELIYFFVQTGSDDTQTVAKILQHLFSQLLSKAGAHGKKLRNKCTEIVKTARQKIRGSSEELVATCNMPMQELLPLFESIVQAFENQVILIIDGLDECVDLESEDFLGILKGFSKAGLPLKALVASRPEHFIGTAFTDVTRIEVTKKKTEKDIQQYLIEEVRGIQHIPKDKKGQAARIINKKADGMFRYANLAIDFLKHPFRGTFQQKLEKFPDAMEDFYKQNLEKMDEKMRELLLIALRWRIYGQGSGVNYSAVQVAEEFEHKYEDDEGAGGDSGSEGGVDTQSQRDEGEEDDWWPSDEEEEGEAATTTTTAAAGASKDSEFQLTIELLRRAGGEFLAIGPNNILELRHKSVQDFIIDYAEKVTKKLVHRRTFCPSCLESEHTSFIYQLSPRQAHLHMALICLKHLNNEQFFKDHLLEGTDESASQEGSEGEPESEPEELGEEAEEGEDQDEADSDWEDEEDEAPESGGQTTLAVGEEAPDATQADDAADGDSEGDDVDADQAVASGEESEEEGGGEDGQEPGEDPSDGDSSDGDSDGEESPHQGLYADIDAEDTNGYDVADFRLGSRYEYDIDFSASESQRYEIQNWSKHINKAWKLSHGEGVPELEQSETAMWQEVWKQVDKFLVEDSCSYISWNKKRYPWRTGILNPIHVATDNSLLEMVKRYVANGIDVNTKSEAGHTPLYHCTDDSTLIKFLVEHGADLNAQDSWKQTPLLSGIAYLCYERENVKYMLENGADPSIPDELNTTCVHWAAHHGDLELIKLFLNHEKHKVDLNAKDSEGETPLHWVLKSTTASIPILELLLENGADINAKDNSQQGPLYEAVKAGNLAAVRILLKNGVSIDDQEDVFERAALHVSVDAANVEMTKTLVGAGARLDIRDANGLTPLAVAAYKGLPDLVKLLLDTEKGSNVEYRGSADNRGRTALHFSASRGYMEVIKLLLDTPDASVLCTKQNEHGSTPLHSAARRGHRLEEIKILLDKGADMSIANNLGKTAFELALEIYGEDYEASRDTVKFLVEIDPKWQDTRTLHLAVAKGDEDLCQMLFKAGLDPTTKDSHGWDSVAIAEHYDHERITSIISNSFGVANDADGLSQLPPTAWSATDKSTILWVSDDGLTASQASTADLNSPGSARANHPIPSDVNIFYYESTVLSSDQESPEVAFGFCDEWARIQYTLPGWVDNRTWSCGWHADDSNLYAQHISVSAGFDIGHEYGRNWGAGDTVGCGVDFAKGIIFFTLNGNYLGPAFTELSLRGRIFPVCGTRVEWHNAKWRTNFGGEKFLFDIDKYKSGKELEVCIPPRE